MHPDVEHGVATCRGSGRYGWIAYWQVSGGYAAKKTAFHRDNELLPENVIISVVQSAIRCVRELRFVYPYEAICQVGRIPLGNKPTQNGSRASV